MMELLDRDISAEFFFLWTGRLWANKYPMCLGRVISVGTMEKLSCISRPRRFGKSYAAKMLSAYYDCSCDSHSLFDDKEIAQTDGYSVHLN